MGCNYLVRLKYLKLGLLSITLVLKNCCCVGVQAVKDLELKYERALHSTDCLLLSCYLKHSTKIFALLTNDSDFLM